MELIDRRMTKTTQFGELKASEPFYYPAEGWYGMKLYAETSEGSNAVDIQTGELARIYANEEVVAVNAQIEIL